MTVQSQRVARPAALYPPDVAVYDLSEGELAEIDALLNELADDVPSAEDPRFVDEAYRIAAAHLPLGLIRFLNGFRLYEDTAGIVVRGFEIDDEKIGPTPPHWREQPDPGSTLREEIYFVLVCSLLGDIFGWTTLQNGHLVHNVLPIAGDENEQSGHGTTFLAWHTEDGFHPYRCDYLALLGLRNNDRVATTFASVRSLRLSDDDQRILAEPRFVIRADTEHLRGLEQAKSTDGAGVDAPEMDGLWDEPAPTAVLFGDLDDPYLRIDPFFMSPVPGDEEAEAALAAIVGQLDDALADLPIDAGEIGIVDNFRAIHGRRAFKARYDGHDRWLKKSVVTRDLRKSRAIRSSPGSRILLQASLDLLRDAERRR
jgi:Fe(II)/alpha-ketoglutarate-dependent arginine beta-hydroxylase